MVGLRSKLIRLAYGKPELRAHLLPLLKEATFLPTCTDGTPAKYNDGADRYECPSTHEVGPNGPADLPSGTKIDWKPRKTGGDTGADWPDDVSDYGKDSSLYLLIAGTARMWSREAQLPEGSITPQEAYLKLRDLAQNEVADRQSFLDWIEEHEYLSRPDRWVTRS